MSLERYSNIDEIREKKGLSRGITWKTEQLGDLVLDSMIVRPTETPVVELHVYTPSTETYLGGDKITDFIVKEDKLYIDYVEAFKKFNLTRGLFRTNVNVFKEVISSVEEPILQIKEISPDRREILVVTVPTVDEGLYDGIIQEYLDTYSSGMSAELAMNFGKNNFIKIIGHKDWIYENDMVLRLYEPLPDDVLLNARFSIVEKLADPYIDDISLDLVPIPIEPNILQGPNWEVDSGYTTLTETDFRNWTQLLDANTSTSQKVIDKIFSGSLSGAELGIDYTAFDNFVYYGSAEERLINFKQKLQNIEYYNTRLDTLNTTSGSSSGSLSKNIKLTTKRRDNVIGMFTSFERWLYNEPTASIYTFGETGSFIGADGYAVTPWPKYMSASRYFPYTTDHARSEAWYNGFVATASLYDQENASALIKTIPMHIRQDTNNDQYEKFVNMIGEHFDIPWTYIKNSLKATKFEEHPKRGIDSDILLEVAKSMGYQLTNGKQATQLWQYKLGTDSTGSFASTGSIFSASDEEITAEVWRRTVNNLPYLLKSRGTSNAIKALMNIYGIPQSILSIREYGGPKVSNSWPALIEDRYSYAIRYNSGSYLKYNATHISSSMNDWGIERGNGVIPVMTREWRFRPYTGSSMIMYTQLSSSGDPLTQIALEYTGAYSGSDTYGRVTLAMANGSGSLPMTASTDWIPLYNGEFWNIAYDIGDDNSPYNSGSNTDTTYRIRVQHSSDYIRGKISHSGSLSLTPTDSSHYLSWSNPTVGSTNVVYVGGNTGSRDARKVNIYLTSSLNTTMPGLFSGSMQEYREWLEVLTQDTFDIHTKNPTSYVSGLDPTSSYDTLVRQHTLGSETIGFDLSTNATIISSSHPNQNIKDFTGAAANSTNISAYEFSSPDDPERGNFIPVEEVYYIDGISMGATNFRSNKVRLESNTLVRALSPIVTAEQSSYDYSPVDSNKLGLFYSFADQVNKDIFNQIGRVELDDYIGDPDDEFDMDYPDLKFFAKNYWKKYTNSSDINAFIRIFSQFDFSLFNQIKQNLPERVDEATGMLIEPNSLERSKVLVTKRPGITNPQYDARVNQIQPTASGKYEDININGEIDRQVLIVSGTYLDEYTGNTMLGHGTGSMQYCTIANYPADERPIATASLLEVSKDKHPNIVLDEPDWPTTITSNNWTVVAGSNYTDTDPAALWDNDDDGGVLRVSLNAGFPTASGAYSKQVRLKYDTTSNFDVKYNLHMHWACTASTAATVRAKFNFIKLEDPTDIDSRIINTYASHEEQIRAVAASSNVSGSFIIPNVIVPRDENVYVAVQVRRGTLTWSGPLPAGTTMVLLNEVRLEKEIVEVCHSPLQQYVDGCRTSDIYKRVVYHYSGSNVSDDLQKRNAYHATSQSKGMFYSRSLDDACYRDDFFTQEQNMYYNGTQLVGPSINGATNIAALGNLPVIEVFETNPNQIFYSKRPAQSSAGRIRVPGNISIR